MLARLAVAGACGLFILHKLTAGEPRSFMEVPGLPGLYALLGFALLLTPLNWYLEALKWKLCVKPVALLENHEALNAVLRGLSLNWVLPFSIGDFVGRMLGIEKTGKTIQSIMLNKYASLLVTLILGVSGTLWIFNFTLFIPLSLIASVGLIVLVTPGLFSDYLKKDIFGLFVLTVFRHCVFTCQFILIASFMVPDIPLTAWVMGTPVVLAIKSVVPSFFGGIGLREAATVAIFGLYTDSVGELAMASLLIWMINIVIPSIYGLVPIITYKLKPQR